MPYALLEAMLEKVPCVVSKCDGNSDVINNNENGFDCLNTEEFVTIILYLIGHPTEVKRIGEAGKKYVAEKHDIKNAVQALQNIYAEMAAL